MAKRFTDTTKWGNSWYRKMPWSLRDLWDYILDHCDHAGIWRVDLELASFVIGAPLDLKDVLACFADRIIQLKSDKWFIPSFVSFQYGDLKSDSRPHQAVISILEKNGIDVKTLTLSKGYPKGIHTTKDKEQDQNQDQAKDQDKESAKKLNFDFEEIYKTYPRKVGKAAGIVTLTKTIKTQAQYENLKKAVANYAVECSTRKIEPNFIKHFSSFIGPAEKPFWPDYVDPQQAQINSDDEFKDWTPEA